MLDPCRHWSGAAGTAGSLLYRLAGRKIEEGRGFASTVALQQSAFLRTLTRLRTSIRLKALQ
jgi:hypothetical protein